MFNPEDPETIISINQSIHLNSKVIASILRKSCYFLRASLVQVQLQSALVWGCVLYPAPDAAEVLSATERGEIDVSLVYIVLSLKKQDE